MKVDVTAEDLNDYLSQAKISIADNGERNVVAKIYIPETTQVEEIDISVSNVTAILAFENLLRLLDRRIYQLHIQAKTDEAQKRRNR